MISLPSQDKVSELEGLEDIDWEAIASAPEDVQQKIVEELVSLKNRDILSELSPNQIKLLTKIDALGHFCNDAIKQRVATTFPKFMINKERRGRSRLEEMGMPPTLPLPGPGLKDRLWSKFGKKG